jgi:type II secretion system protein G
MAALRHEFAHIARNDFLNRGLAQIACALYWPNPLVWLAARHWRLEQEMACDDAVLQHGAPAADYAEQLVEVARNFIRPVLGQRRTLAMAQPCTLEARVKAVLDGRRDRSSAGRGIRMVLSTVLIAALAASALAQTGVAKSNAGNANGAVFVLSDTASMAKAKKIIIPKFEVKDVSLTKAVDFLRQLSTKFDSEPDPRRRGVNIFIKLSPGAAELPNVTVKLENVSLADALKQIARLGGLELTANDQALALVPAGSIPKLSDTVYVVPTGMRLLFKGKDEAALKQMFESAGISFGQGASVTFEEPDTLSVRNTDEARRLISSILQRNLATALQTHSPTPQSIEARASEIRLPKVTFRGATLPDALDILRKMAVEADPEKKGVAILLQPAAEQHAADYRVTLQLVDIPLLEAVKYVAVAGDVAARVSGQGIVIETAQDASRLVTREYKVDKGFLATAKDDAALQKVFADNGVAFPPNATLWKTPRGFAMRNTEAQHAILAGMLEDPASQQSGVADDAKAARGKTDLQAISVQLETYRKITGAYPTTAQGLKALWEKPADLPTGAKWVQLMASEPGDPFGRTYQYRRSADGKSYEVFGLGPDGVESADDVR